jgi:hypothetical protein
MSWTIVFWWELILAGAFVVIIIVRAVGMRFALKKDRQGVVKVHSEEKEANSPDA